MACEYSLRNIRLVPICSIRIQCGENIFMAKGFSKIIHAWKRIGISHFDNVEPPVIDAESIRTIALNV